VRLSEEKGIVYILKPADHAAGVAGESINTKGFRHVTFLVQCATLTDNGVSNLALLTAYRQLPKPSITVLLLLLKLRPMPMCMRQNPEWLPWNCSKPLLTASLLS